MDKLSFLCSPYSHTDPEVVKERVLKTQKLAAYLIQQRVFIYSAIVHGHYILEVEKNLPSDWEFWQHYCKTFMEASEKIYVFRLEGWKESTGVQAEIKIAIELNKPIIFVDELEDGTYKFEDAQDVGHII